jgi:hypothetical protein
MGLQDRDYYREKHTATETPPSSRSGIRTSGRNSSGINYLLYFLITIAALWYGSYLFLDNIYSIIRIPPPVADRTVKPIESASEGVIAQHERSGVARSIGNTLGEFSAGVGAG